MLMTMRANNEAMRAALYDTAARIDVEGHGADEEARTTASERVALMIPILKAWCTDLGVEMASLGVQVHGGMGYVEETGAAQFLRDARIAPIYEGTNGIQALDLVTRKVPLRSGQVVKEYLAEMSGIAADLRTIGGFEKSADELDRAIGALTEASTHVEARMAAGEYAEAAAGATPFTRMWGTVVGGAFLAKSALAASSLPDDGPADTGPRAKQSIARFYCEQILPTANGLLASVLAPSEPLFDLSNEELTV
jgi:alkylation response protein AidB-like acyl-CoA dehydrogenase